MVTAEERLAETCARKVPYSRKTATQIAQKMRREGRQVSAYRCLACREWHVGTTPQMDEFERQAAALRARRDPTLAAAAEPEHTRRWYIAVCVDCGTDLVQPFRSEERRDEWTAEHASATGHTVVTRQEIR